MSECRREPCPWLPEVSERLGPETTRRHVEKGADFYFAALRYSQSLWLEGKPAQAILQLNKAWMADLTGDEEVLKVHGPPYGALRWILEKAKDGSAGFLGDPVRHFQHLATRMSGPRGEIRTWRAWACFWISCRELEGRNFFRDGGQLVREGIWIPGKVRVSNEVRGLGWRGESEHLPF